MRALVAGGGGFIGGHLVERLLGEGHSVVAADIKPIDDWWQVHPAACHIVVDLARRYDAVLRACRDVDVVYQLAADMGGAGYIFSGNYDANVMHNSGLINHNILHAGYKAGVKRFFYSSSACIYPADKQEAAAASALKESDAYPANPDSEYGWEKLFSERLYHAYARNYDLDVCIARFHNIYGPCGTYVGGREKAPAAICRKVLEAKHGCKHEIEIWGDGNQVRSFCWIDDCIEGVMRLMASDFRQPLNIGSSESVTINQLVDLAESFAGIKLTRHYKLDAPKGVAGRNSDNALCKTALNWEPTTALVTGLEATYRWIERQLYN